MTTRTPVWGRGNQTSLIDADGNTTLTSYDGLGDVTLLQVYNSSGTFFASESMSYDASGTQTQLLDWAGNTTLSSYDDGRMTKQVVYDAGHSGQTASWSFDDAGNVTKFISFEGFTTLSTFDDGNLVSQTVDMGAAQVDSETWAYDDNDNVTSHEDNNGNVTASTYNGEGLIFKQTITNGATTLGSESWLYDASGNVTDLIDVVSTQTRETKSYFNGLGQKTEEIDGYGSAASATIQYSFDDNGNQTKEIDADGNTTQFAYNAFGNVTWTENPSGYTSTMQYDAGGNMTSELDFDGRLQWLGYDAFGHETSNIWYSGSTTSTTEVDSLSFGYDANGNETLASDSEGSYTLDYDPLGRLTLVDEPFGASLSFSYDGVGNRTLVTDNFSGTQSSSYNADNQLISEQYIGQSQTLLTSFTYDYLGEQTTEVMLYGGTTTVSTNVTSYDSSGNVTNIHDVTAASTTVNFDYSYDVASELTKEIDNASTTISYSYNATGELTGAGTGTYAYDAGGNDHNTGDTVTTGNELTSDGTYNYTFDDAGNETSKTDIATSDSWAYSYNNANELVSAVETNASSQTENSVVYEYDAMGNKIEATTVEYGTAGYAPSAVTTTTKYAIDQWNPGNGSGVSSVWADLNVSDGLQTRYMRTDDPTQILARIDNSGTPTAYWYLLDRQNSTRDIITNTAALKDTINYDAYGNILPGEETAPQYGGNGSDRCSADPYALNSL